MLKIKKIEGPKIQSKIQIVFINGNKLVCFISKNVLNPKNGPAYCKVVSAILFCEKRPHCITDSRRKEGARAKSINMHCKKIELVSIENVK